MWTRHRRRSPLRHLLLPMIGTAVLSYFSHHAMNGTLGLAAQKRYATEIALLESELAHVETRRAALEKKTAMLRDGSLERDMIDEQARRLLGLTRHNEIVIFHAASN